MSMKSFLISRMLYDGFGNLAIVIDLFLDMVILINQSSHFHTEQ
jgi:hypothetical protein